jgi:hypothetical protein
MLQVTRNEFFRLKAIEHVSITERDHRHVVELVPPDAPRVGSKASADRSRQRLFDPKCPSENILNPLNRL